jgi:TRAP-type C4-dicarboxylate transport system substrate-binding protein
MLDRRRPTVAGLVIVLSVTAGGCAVRGPVGDKAGGVPGGKVVLVLADVSSGLQERPAVQYLIRRVDVLSGGNVTIQVRFNWASPNPDAEQQVVRATAAGTVDLGVVGSRVFDTMGVRSFQALSAPTLIDSYPLENRVVRSHLARRMLAGLAPLNVTGLGLLAGGLRKPVAVKRPLLGPADWRGIPFGTYLSKVQEGSIRALGAAPVVAFSSLRVHLLSTGQLNAFEFNLLNYYANAYWSVARYITANVNLWPQADVLVANPARLSKLTSQQLGWLDQAVRESADRAAGLMATAETRALPRICARGARLAQASQMDLARLRQEFRPVYADLEQDRQTRSFIAQIQSIKRMTPAGPSLAIPQGCEASGAASR